MTDENAAAVDRLLIEKLDAASLSNVICAAPLNADELGAVVDGAVSTRPKPKPSAVAPEPIGTYLASIDVSGFRGIGAPVKLDLVPAPGLTVVVGCEWVWAANKGAHGGYQGEKLRDLIFDARALARKLAAS